MVEAQISSPSLRETRLLDSEELPIKALRKRLTVLFVLISISIYLIASALALVVSYSSLGVSLDANLKRLLADVQPSVEIRDGHLTLSAWAARAKSQNLHILHVIQLYDRDGHLEEEYGAPGTKGLKNGRCGQFGLQFSHDLRSKFVPVQEAGFLQVQVDAKQTDEACMHFLLTMLALVPVVAATAGLAGYMFCGEAVAPVSRSFQLLRRFVDDAGHELRTPVAIISASLETLESAMANDAENARVVDMVNRAVTRLKNLSGGLVTLASMESPEMQLSLTELDIDSLVRQVCGDFQGAALDKQIQLTCETASGASVSGNSDALQRMLSNLLDNAIRYVPSAGKVSVTSQYRSGQVVISIQDNGVGIPENSLPHVFDRFYRVDKARTRQQGGTGLGLSIVKAVAEAHHGSVTVESQLDSGSTFTVTLPARGDTSKLVNQSRVEPNLS